MQTSAAGSDMSPPRSCTACGSQPPEEALAPGGGPAAREAWRFGQGFTLIELLVVVAIIAIGGASVMFAMRDASALQLEREAQRLASLLEAGRAHSRATGQVVRWQAVAGGFRFESPTENGLPRDWLSDQVQVRGTPVLVLGPEPVIGPQAVELLSPLAPERSLLVATDGLHPFIVSSEGPP